MIGVLYLNKAVVFKKGATPELATLHRIITAALLISSFSSISDSLCGQVCEQMDVHRIPILFDSLNDSFCLACWGPKDSLGIVCILADFPRSLAEDMLAKMCL